MEFGFSSGTVRCLLLHKPLPPCLRGELGHLRRRFPWLMCLILINATKGDHVPAEKSWQSCGMGEVHSFTASSVKREVSHYRAASAITATTSARSSLRARYSRQNTEGCQVLRRSCPEASGSCNGTPGSLLQKPLDKRLQVEAAINEFEPTMRVLMQADTSRGYLGQPSARA